jgi:lysophospholipase L1-like esterase
MRVVLLGVILAAEFVVLEIGLNASLESEASSPFQTLFIQDSRIGYRPRPGAATTYSTAEFRTELRINGQGVRDDEEIGPKAPGERRIVILGDSLVLAVQVPLAETFGKRLEARLNDADRAHRWRVINAGVQGYGPVEDWLFFEHVVSAFQPDIVIVTVFVGNDAVEASGARTTLAAGRVPVVSVTDSAQAWLRRVIRYSQVLQRVRVRIDQLRSRLTASVPELPLASYLDNPPAAVTEGFDLARQAFGRIADRADQEGAATVFVLMPARFQIDDADFGRLDEAVSAAGGTLRRNLATERFLSALAPLGRPTLDLLPVLWAQDRRDELFFQRNVHLTPRGHQVVADALFSFLETREPARVGRR